jgi:GNAT superfamily N-acetyltransferase
VSVERASIEDLATVADEPHAFWGERELPALHHPLLVHEFGETAFVVREEGGRVIAYLFGLLTPARVGYIHLVAVREGHRRAGLARALYGHFAAVARDLGATSLKAFTQPVNTTSIAFHRSLGFLVSEVPDYVGPGELRVVFTRELPGG